MAHFESVGNFVTLAPGGTHYWDFWFSPIEDVGAALATPNINDGFIGVHLTTSDLGQRTVPSRDTGEDAVPRIRYTVTVRNAGTVSVSYNLDLGHFQ